MTSKWCFYVFIYIYVQALMRMFIAALCLHLLFIIPHMFYDSELSLDDVHKH